MNNAPTCCPKCGRAGLRTLTWRELGISDTTLGCWECDWLTYPPGVTADNWQALMQRHKPKPAHDSALHTIAQGACIGFGISSVLHGIWEHPWLAAITAALWLLSKII